MSTVYSGKDTNKPTVLKKNQSKQDKDIHRSTFLKKDLSIQDEEEYVKPPENKFYNLNKSGAPTFFDNLYHAHILELKDLFINGRPRNLSKVLARQRKFISYKFDGDDEDILDFITQ